MSLELKRFVRETINQKKPKEKDKQMSNTDSKSSKINNAFAALKDVVVVNPPDAKTSKTSKKTKSTKPKDVKFTVKVGNDEPEQGVKVNVKVGKEPRQKKDKTPKDKTATRAVLVNLDMPTSVLFYELSRSGKFFDKNNPTAVARALIEQFVNTHAPKQTPTDNRKG